ncbi:MAG: allantoinase AllB [Gemmatimonadota bacterium]|nr:allantoinase AllB [Gemmatimonadota bacterium]
MTRPAADLVIRSRRVVTAQGLRAAAVHVATADGRIVAVTAWDEAPAGVTRVDAKDALVMPGVVDSHVHVNEPGRSDWEGFATATRAAAAGGVTTLCDMPLNSIPATTTVAALEAKRRAAQVHASREQASQAHASVHVEFIGGVVPGNRPELEGLAAAGVCAFKCFLAPSGVEEFPHVGERELREAFPVLARTGLPLMVHAEDPARLVAPLGRSDPRAYATWLASRPVDAEQEAIALVVRLMEEVPTPVHIVHLSSAGSLDMVRVARARGLPITVETCPHYLTFAAEEIPDGATAYKCAPPIRRASEREALWYVLIAGEIDLVASDHSPCPPAMKRADGDFIQAWGGIASLELSLPAVWTGARARGVPPERLAQWMCEAPARLVGLGQRRGVIAPGYDADLVVWDPEASFTVHPARLHQRHKVTPYIGRELFGVVRATYVSGRLVHGGV